MEPEPQEETSLHDSSCPECGAEETGYFCRSCGALVRGEDLVLCPRCHQIVPAGDFCNKCGQTLTGLALNLQQLAMAGDEFWVTAAVPASRESSADDTSWGTLEPDSSVELADADLPDWFNELPSAEAPPEVRAHIYPSLVPIESEARQSRRSPFFVLAMALLGLTLLSLVILVIYFFLNSTWF